MDNTVVLFRRNPNFIFRKIVEETILVPVFQDVADMDAIYTLNELGAFIWEKLAEPLPESRLQVNILEEFDVDAATITDDLGVFLEEMEAIGAVERVKGA